MKVPGKIWSKIPARKWIHAVNRDVAVFAFFLFLSFGLWYINFLGKEMETEIKFPAEYVNIPKDRVIDQEMPMTLNFMLKGPGFSVLKLKISGNKSPVEIDLSKISYKRVPATRNPDYYILTSGLLKNLTIQLKTGCEIVSISPDTLFFTLSRPSPKPALNQKN